VTEVLTDHQKIGYMRTCGLLMSLDWPDSVVSRGTIRAVLPAGDTANAAFRRFLNRAYERGHAQFGRRFIRVLDRAELRAYALHNLQIDATIGDFIDLRRLRGIIQRQINAVANPAIRRRRQAELHHLQLLNPAEVLGPLT
jgi:hypothetical protein